MLRLLSSAHIHIRNVSKVTRCNIQSQQSIHTRSTQQRYLRNGMNNSLYTTNKYISTEYLHKEPLVDSPTYRNFTTTASTASNPPKTLDTKILLANPKLSLSYSNVDEISSSYPGTWLIYRGNSITYPSPDALSNSKVLSVKKYNTTELQQRAMQLVKQIELFPNVNVFLPPYKENHDSTTSNPFHLNLKKESIDNMKKNNNNNQVSNTFQYYILSGDYGKITQLIDEIRRIIRLRYDFTYATATPTTFESEYYNDFAIRKREKHLQSLFLEHFLVSIDQNYTPTMLTNLPLLTQRSISIASNLRQVKTAQSQSAGNTNASIHYSKKIMYGANKANLHGISSIPYRLWPNELHESVIYDAQQALQQVISSPSMYSSDGLDDDGINTEHEAQECSVVLKSLEQSSFLRTLQPTQNSLMTYVVPYSIIRSAFSSYSLQMNGVPTPIISKSSQFRMKPIHSVFVPTREDYTQCFADNLHQYMYQRADKIDYDSRTMSEIQPTFDTLTLSPRNIVKPIRILDMGVGSGILSIITMDVCRDYVNIFSKNQFQLHACDINEQAVVCTRSNIQKYMELFQKNSRTDANVTDNIHIFESKLFSNVNKRDKYDLIVFNPPWIPKIVTLEPLQHKIRHQQQQQQQQQQQLLENEQEQYDRELQELQQYQQELHSQTEEQKNSTFGLSMQDIMMKDSDLSSSSEYAYGYDYQKAFIQLQTLDSAVTDPNRVLLSTFLNNVKQYLADDGSCWIVLSTLPFILGMETEKQLLKMIEYESGLRIQDIVKAPGYAYQKPSSYSLPKYSTKEEIYLVKLCK